jgi:hypothetical protein
MRTLWRGLVRIVFWSFERGTWPYDVAVAAIVVFVLLSPRSWFNDRPPVEMASARQPAMVESRGNDPADGAEIYRVDARLVSATDPADSPDLTQQLREAVRKNAKDLPDGTGFDVVRVVPVLGHDGAIAYYDVCIQPQE